MSLGTCIPGMVKRGEIDQQRANRMSELFDELERYYARSMGPDAAAAEASEATLKQLAAENRLKKRQALLQIARQRDAVKDIGRYRGPDRYAAVRGLIDDDDLAPYRRGNVETAATRIRFGIHGQIQQFIERHRRNLLGRPHDAEGLDDVVRELHGQATGNERAKVFADSLSEAFETLRRRFNAAGGNIGKLEGFGLPHRHDALKVRMAGREAWIADILPDLDRSRMIDERTGVPYSDAELTRVLGEIHETIRTNGLTGEASTAFAGPGKMANSRADHRFLHFRDGDAWLRYDAKYGGGDNPFTAIMGHIGGMSKDIAMMERLGPNPNATMRYLLDHVDRQEAQSDKARPGVVIGKSSGRTSTERLWDFVRGASNIPVRPEGNLGYQAVRFVQGWRNLATARKLGSAPISAFLGDFETGAMARQAYGLSAISEVNNGLMARAFHALPEVKVLQGYLKQLNPLSARNRELAVRLGLGLQDAAQSMTALARYYGEASGPGWTQVAADSVLRVSGLNRITEAGQNLFGIEFLRHLGAHREIGWKALPDELRTVLERGGIDQQDWTAIRHAEPIMSGGAAHIDVRAIKDQGTADRLMDLVLRGRAAAVQETTARSRAATTLGISPGTIQGEAIRSMLQFKGFSFALFMKQMRVVQSLGPYRGAKYAARFFIGATLAGGAMIQARELVKGNDPLPMDNPQFWLKAAVSGGGLGVVGDLFGAVVEPRLESAGEFIGGPILSDVKDVKRAIQKTLPGAERKDGTHREANPGGAAVDLLRSLVPGSNLWYLRAAWERMVIDQLREGVDPTVDQQRARKAKAMQKDRHGNWWAPGEMAPSRAPDLSTAVGSQPPP